MFGLLLVGVYAAYQMIFHNAPFETVYLAATHFLVWWYALWAIPGALILFLLSLGITLGGGIAGLGFGSRLSTGGQAASGLAGAAAGGGASLLLWFAFLVKTAARVGGAYLLFTALTLGAEGGATWDKGRLIVGGVILFVSLLMSRTGSSSSGSSGSSSSKK